MPFFPEKVENVTVKIGQNAVLRCRVENLNNYKVSSEKNEACVLVKAFLLILVNFLKKIRIVEFCI